MLARGTTADELLARPGDGYRYELVRGVLRRMPPPAYWHGSCAMRCGVLIGSYVYQRRLGEVFAAETGFQLSREPDTVRAPDFAFVRNQRVPAVPPEGYFQGAPDLALEVVSPGDTRAEVEEKARSWLAHGCSLVWVVDLMAKNVTAYRPDADARVLTAGDELSAEDLLPGFRCKVAALFGS